MKCIKLKNYQNTLKQIQKKHSVSTDEDTLLLIKNMLKQALQQKLVEAYILSDECHIHIDSTSTADIEKLIKTNL